MNIWKEQSVILTQRTSDASKLPEFAFTFCNESKYFNLKFPGVRIYYKNYIVGIG